MIYRRPRRIGRTLMLIVVPTLVMAMPVSAADQVTQVVTAGARTASVANLTLGSVATSHSAQTSTGTMTLTADDSTGSNLGWNVTILSSAFVYSGSNSGSDIPASNFSLTSAAAPTRTAGQAVDATGGPRVPVISPVGTLDSARKTLQALVLFGNGTYTQALGVSLTIPADSAAGTYTGTLTTTIAAAP
jgi:WxL domain surface cell wall-binding